MQHSSITLEVYFRKVRKLLLRRLHHSDDIRVKSYVRIIMGHPIERVQRRATKLVSELRNLPYPERLRALNQPSLYYRRRRGDMIAVYQMLHGGFDLDQSIFFNAAHARDTRSHPLRLVKPHAVTRIRRNAFSVRVVNDWNSLPGSVVTSDTKKRHRRHLRHSQPIQEQTRRSLVTHKAHNSLCRWIERLHRQLNWNGP